MNQIDLVMKAMEYIGENAGGELSSGAVAAWFNYSPFHFHRIFKQITDMTVTDYIREKRLELAAGLLLDTGAGMLEVCLTCGFENPQTFNRLFKRKHGLTPREFRLAGLRYAGLSPAKVVEDYMKRREHSMAVLDNFEIERFGPYRFIGKSVYARSGAGNSGVIFGGLWGNSKWIFDAIGGLSEYASDETFNTALLTWDKYDEKKQLLGYTVGRFMKAGAPVPEGLDYFDIPAMFAAKGWVRGEFADMIANEERLTSEALNQQTKYVPNWDETSFMAEVYTEETVPREGVSSTMGYYIACGEKED